MIRKERNNMKSLFIFAAGLAVGAIAGACLVRNKALEDAKQEVEEVREYYRNKHDEVKEEEPQVEVEVPQDVDVVKDIVKENGYTNYNKPESINVPQYDDPYVIDPSEFGEEPGYDTMTLTYFADGVLVDDVDDVIEEADVVVGLENLKVFEEFGATAVYVRNDIYRTDYEILRDDWNYSDLKEPPFEKKPHQL
jgi:hypothetical protein